jgi:hypothetical protein
MAAMMPAAAEGSAEGDARMRRKPSNDGEFLCVGMNVNNIGLFEGLTAHFSGKGRERGFVVAERVRAPALRAWPRKFLFGFFWRAASRLFCEAFSYQEQRLCLKPLAVSRRR